MDYELKFIYFCPKCGLRFVTGLAAEFTCDEGCGARLTPYEVEHWDCNGEFVFSESFAAYCESI